MALLQSLPTPSCASAGYHRIVHVEIKAREQVLVLMVAMYVNQAARDADRPLWHEYVTVPFAQLAVNPLAPLYELLTTVPGSLFHAAPGDGVAPPGSYQLTLVPSSAP
jgi:hypothetical protein